MSQNKENTSASQEKEAEIKNTESESIDETNTNEEEIIEEEENSSDDDSSLNSLSIEEEEEEESPNSFLRFCDYIAKQIRCYPYLDYRFVNKQYSKSFQMNLQFYTGMLNLTGALDHPEEEKKFQKEIDLWAKITTDYGDTLLKSDRPDKYEKVMDALAVYRIYHKINVLPQDIKREASLKKSGKLDAKKSIESTQGVPTGNNSIDKESDEQKAAEAALASSSTASKVSVEDQAERDQAAAEAAAEAQTMSAVK